MYKYIALGAIWSMILLISMPFANAYYDDQQAADNYYNKPVHVYDEQRRQKRFSMDRSSTLKISRKNYYKNSDLMHMPFPSKISSGNVIKVDLGKRVWGAYDGNGNLIKSGRASGGKDYCPDIRRGCRTITGTYTIYSKKGPSCKSSRFPVGRGGAPMPYCMHFRGGYALHGGQVPDYNASHGCIRLYYRDAQWLNQNFVRVGSTRVSIHY